MASNANIFSLDELWSMKCSDLKKILKDNKQITSGNKQILVARCYSLNPVVDDEASDHGDAVTNANVSVHNVDPFSHFDESKSIGFTELLHTAKDRQWETDLRRFPPVNFHQLYEYLLVKTQKYGDKEIKGSSHKKMKSYQFFKEGHIKTYEIARGFGKVWVKSKVVASMRHETYRVMVVCQDDGDILYAACECPAGLGKNGAGKCNHVGGLLFALNDFNDKGLHDRPEKVSCTSKLNGWIVPRNLTVKPKPLKDIKVKKVQFGKEAVAKQTVNEFDPRAPQDRNLNTYAFNNLFNRLEEYSPNSSFFLYHDPPSSCPTDMTDVDFYDTIDSTNVGFQTCVTATGTYNKEKADTCLSETRNLQLVTVDKDIDDEEDINENFIKSRVLPVIENETLNEDDINYVEKVTRGQSESSLWKTLHMYKATASNFGRIIKCSKNPDGLIKSMFYSEPISVSLTYGKENEPKAVDAYINYKKAKGVTVDVKSVGILLSKDKPGLGASLDGVVTDPSSDPINGGLEVKCPISKAGMTINEACADTSFYLTQSNGTINLKRNSNYYFQVQGQMFVSNLKWVDFVVWFGSEKDIFVERIQYDSDFWLKQCLPKLDLFYKWVVVPELLTRRVQRKVPLIKQTQWKLLLSKS